MIEVIITSSVLILILIGLRYLMRGKISHGLPAAGDLYGCRLYLRRCGDQTDGRYPE